MKNKEELIKELITACKEEGILGINTRVRIGDKLYYASFSFKDFGDNLRKEFKGLDIRKNAINKILTEAQK